jgi:Flp pilus assembly pilin Flp
LGSRALDVYLRDTSGATSSEYALILGAICIGLLAVVIALGDAIGGATTKVNNGFPSA